MQSLAFDDTTSQLLVKLFQASNLPQRIALAQSLHGMIGKLARDKHGCWVVQSAIENVPAALQATLVQELKSKVVACSQNMHGNFVLQKCIELLPAAAITFMIEELESCAVEMAMHMYACRVLQRLIEHCHPEQHLSRLIQNLLSSTSQLINDSYGNNVVRAILIYGSLEHKQCILEAVINNVEEFSTQKNSSLVLEKCLEISTVGLNSKELKPLRDDLMDSILGQDGDRRPPFERIMLDRFGNYIVQNVITFARTPSEFSRLQRLLEANKGKLRRSAHGKHILAVAKRRFAACASQNF